MEKGKKKKGKTLKQTLSADYPGERVQVGGKIEDIYLDLMFIFESTQLVVETIDEIVKGKH